MLRKVFMSLTLCLLFSCVTTDPKEKSSCKYASYFDFTDSIVTVISPYDGSEKTLNVAVPLDNIVCMSSSHVACLSAIWADSLISAVSGLRYISDRKLHERCCPDVGYESAMDYEMILSIAPDLLLAYTVSGVEPQYVSKLRSLGVPVLVLYDHLENHPLARAEYVRLFGAMTGRRQQADSVFQAVRNRYSALADSVACTGGSPLKVLMNIPYGDAWYIPGADSYMSRLIEDAGGEILGSKPGSASSVISLENAYLLSQKADIWLAPGNCRSREELSSLHHAFPSFGPLANDLPIYNNTLRSTPEGGNDFWESGSVRPDLILEDLVNIFASDSASLNYFVKIKECSDSAP